MSGTEFFELPVRAGVVGAGFFGRLHAQKYAALPNVELAGIADPDMAATFEIADRLRAMPLASHRELIGRADCASVVSPATTHAAIALDLIEAGLHVLIEKPIATNLADADRVIALAARKNVIVQTGYQERFVFARSGLLNLKSRPREIECVRAGTFNGRGGDVSVALDLMTHDLDLVHRIDPSAVIKASAAVRARPDSFSDEVSAELLLASGTRVKLLSSRMAHARNRTMRLVFADGEIEIDFLNRRLRNTTREEISSSVFPSGDAAAISSDPLGYSITRFVGSVRTGEQPLVTPADARRALETALLILDVAGAPATLAQSRIHA